MKKPLSVKKTIENDYFFSIISRVISVIIGIFHAAFFARFLGPELKGISASISSIVSVGSVVLTFGIHQAFPYYRKKDLSHDFINKFASNVLVIYIFLFVLALFLFCFIPTGIIIKGSILLIPLFGYETIINYVFLIESPKRRNLVNITASFIETAVLFLFWIFLKPNNMLMLIGISLSVIIRMIASTAKVGVGFNIKLFDIKYLFELFKFGLLPMFSLLLTMLNSRIDILMLNTYTSVSAAQIGIYSVGVGLAEKALLIPDAIKEILLGKLVSGKETDEVSRACRIGTAISLFITLCIMFFGNIVIAILYGNEYCSSYLIMLISSLGTVFMVYIKMISQYNIVHKKQKANAMLLLISVAVNVVLNIVLIPILGIVGAAIGTLAGHFVCGVCFIIFFMKSEKVSIKRLIILQRDDLKALKRFFYR